MVTDNSLSSSFESSSFLSSISYVTDSSNFFELCKTIHSNFVLESCSSFIKRENRRYMKLKEKAKRHKSEVIWLNPR